MAAPEVLSSTETASLEMEVMDDTFPSSSWRIRDMAEELLYKRSIDPSSSPEKNLPLQNTMSMSTHFDTDTSLARIRRDKIGVVRKSFGAAADAVLESLQIVHDQASENETVNDEDLPSILTDVKKLETMRAKSFERAHDNKDVAKRKAAFESSSSSGMGSNGTKGKKGEAAKKSDAPKFTRNTPASSAAALDARLTNSRAILCTAANVAFEALTPQLSGLEVDVVNIPQNPNKNTESKSTVNMGAVVVEAQTLGQRIEAVAENAARRSARRYQYRKDNLRYDRPKKSILQVRNPFAWKDGDEEDEDGIQEQEHIFRPSEEAITTAWANVCLPRLISIFHTGVGHAAFHDVNWATRHGRISNMLEKLSKEDGDFGPHLIVTVEPDVDRFAQEFRAVNSHLRLMSTVNTESLRALRYTGTVEQRTKLRKQFPEATGLPDAPFHVIITSYAHFLQDYLHFCQMPFEVAIIDDGVSWMAAAQGDPNSKLATVWDSAMWSKNDHQMGLAGAFHKDWDFSVEKFDEETVKQAWIGLTARHRVVTSSTLRVQQRSGTDLLPVSGLVNFIAPHYADTVREEWDRSRITTDNPSMQHFRTLLTRSIVVHDPEGENQDAHQLAIRALQGELPVSERSEDPQVPDLISDELFVSDGKVAQSRRSALQWLGTPEESWLRYELGFVSFQQILEAMKASHVHGHLCEEIVTASSTTSTGATGQVAGTLAYRLAVRCGRHFGSEQVGTVHRGCCCPSLSSLYFILTRRVLFTR